MTTTIEPVSKRYVAALCVIFTIFWIAMAIDPLDRPDWITENVLVLVLAGLLVGFRNRFVLSRAATTMLFVFCITHVVGSHYTYAKVPYDDWARALTGTTINEIFGFQRNHFDRLQHFCYGFLLATPVYELMVQKYDVPRFFRYALIVDFTLSTSALYELIEWAAAVSLGSDLGAAYLGTQGDEWDAHADMALATLGALITMTVTYLRDRARGDAARSRA